MAQAPNADSACLCRFGEFIAPSKTLGKSDYYEGHWKDGRMQGLGTYR